MIRYVSTRGHSADLGFEQALLAGLAPDGGLYVPAAWPTATPAEIRALAGRPYAEAAAEIMWPFLAGAMERTAFDALARRAYARFDHAAVAPLVQLDSRLWVLELFHGPTLAFKDVALQLVGLLFDQVLAKSGQRITVIGATSGDTGSAAIEACRDRDAVDIFILYPAGRTSDVQRRQMTTVMSQNVHAIAIDGTFDDCQALVKAMFGDAPFRESLSLAAVNSINWARILAQIVYYFTAAVAVGAPDRPVAFAVPTGNFGNIFAGYAASRMGLGLPRLICGTNRNDILARFFATAMMRKDTVVPTFSPSMDIQVSSNFERLLFELVDRDPARVVAAMAEFQTKGAFSVSPSAFDRAGALFSAAAVDDQATAETIAAVHRSTGYTLDPHSAVGVAAAQRAAAGLDPAIPIVALACAHPAKFPDLVTKATGTRPALPPHLADLFDREERLVTLPNDLAAVQAYVRARARVGGR